MEPTSTGLATRSRYGWEDNILAKREIYLSHGRNALSEGLATVGTDWNGDDYVLWSERCAFGLSVQARRADRGFSVT